MNIPNFELSPFNPNRNQETAVPKKERARILYNFPVIYHEAILAEYQASRGDLSKRSVAVREGQMAGKMFLRMIEGSPASEQQGKIASLSDGIRKVHAYRHIPLNGFQTGFMGEFATGAMIHNTSLDLRYPKNSDDLRHQTDLTAFSPSGKEIAIQSKTIPFLRLVREGIGAPEKWEDRVPIFSPLRDNDEYNEFRDLTLRNGEFSEGAQERLSDVLADAKKFQADSLERGVIPVFCLLGSPSRETSDIIQESYRPTRGATNQARQELQNFIESIDR